ncbi:heme-binding protein [Limnohabitans sp. B9-3]|uniref:SOUL family heme-binding protein n=1 Tax=Limnohabitans sp. B9-3 TaxID=1100707 RepID=UPI001E5B5630|nr:heme-binding protein [Limnohabitans sp. B9-3]
MRLNTHTLIALLAGFLWMEPTMATEEPRYDVRIAQGPFELRHYAPTLIAETVVDGDMDAASGKGFRLIADYIFGNNRAAGSQQAAKIAMTAPVTMEPQSSKIAMTAPVTIEPQSGNTAMVEANQWRIHFVMPSQYTLANIPKPNNSAVTLRELPHKYFVVYRYSGFNTQAGVQEKTNETLAWAKQQSLQVIGTPQLSRYDPPWTLPMFRRNEIMVEVAAP